MFVFAPTRRTLIRKNVNFDQVCHSHQLRAFCWLLPLEQGSAKFEWKATYNALRDECAISAGVEQAAVLVVKTYWIVSAE